MPSGVAEVQHQKSTISNSSPLKPMESGKPSEKKLYTEQKKETREKRETMESTDEGIEVVLADKGASKVVEESTPKRPIPEQNVFRHPHAVRPRPMRAPSGPHHHPYVHGSGSWGYGPPPMHGDYPPPPPPPPPPRPYPVPPYNASGSFEDHHSPYHHTPHYSPHIHYPPPGGRFPPEDVNVISPNHKTDPHYRPPPITPSPRHAPPPHHYYKYPPTSPVSRPGAPASSAPPRLRNYAMRRGGEGAYTRAQRGEAVHPDDGTWNPYVPPSSNSGGDSTKQKPPLVAESFDSDNRPPSPVSSPHPTTPGTAPQPPIAPASDPHYQFYGGGGSWGSFDSAMGPPPHYEDYRYYGMPPESPYAQPPGPFSPGGIYRSESFPPQSSFGPAPSFSYSYDEDDRLFPESPPDAGDEGLQQVTPPGHSKAKSRAKSGTPVVSNRSGGGLVLPKAASEVDFDITDPPATPITPPSKEPVCESIVEVNSFDVLLGRGGGTNSQVGNRRFRKLVQEFQPTYLMVKRKEKPLVARSIVLIIRKRGGRFLKKNEDTGELFEVGDSKAEAKTSQALREGLDVRATSKTMTTKGKKKTDVKSPSSNADEEGSPMSTRSQQSSKKEPPSPLDPKNRPPESPPTLPRLHGEESKAGLVHPHSPENMQFRKRRRMRSADRFFPDFCPPRADLGRANTPPPHGHDDDDDDGVVDASSATPTHRNGSRATYDHDCAPAPGCAGIALDLVTGAARGSFCLGPTGWRR